MNSISLIGNGFTEPPSRAGATGPGHRTPIVRTRSGGSIGGVVSSQIGRLASQVRALGQGSPFAAAVAKSSKESTVSATLGAGGVSGDYEVEVIELARRQITKSTTTAGDPSDTVADGGSISFTLEGGTTEAIALSGATSLTELRDRINAQNSGVVASIATDAITHRLVLTSRETGSGAGFQIHNSLTHSTGTAVAFASGQGAFSGNAQNARNATFTVDGRRLNSTSNTISDAIAGASITLTAEGSSTISLEHDPAALRNAVGEFVDGFNGLDDVRTGLAGVGTDGDVSGERRTLILALDRSLGYARDRLSTAGGRGSVRTAADIGIVTKSNGKLEFDQRRFDDAVGRDPGGVETLVRGGDATPGIFTQLDRDLSGATRHFGLVASEASSLKASRDLEARQQASRRTLAVSLEALRGLDQASTITGRLSGRILPF